VAVVVDETVDVVTGNVAVARPACTVTLAGTVADTLLLDKATEVFAETVPLSVTVPVEEAPPVTVLGFSETEESVTAPGLIVSEAVRARSL
jgi:hypothetical protein